ncbi:MAG: DMT family transporter [Bacteroidales bacterium]|nr:DMT family transporter [Bacteroidales bacterium]
MIYLILAIVFSTGVFVAMRLFERFGLDNHQALMWNYVFAAGTGFIVCERFETIPQLVAEPWFGLSILTGFWFIFTYLLMTSSTQRSGVTVTSLSSKLSVVLPILAGVIWLGEKLNFVATMGIVLALVALVLVVGGRNKESDGVDVSGKVSTRKNGWIVGLLPIFIFFGTGTGDILMKITEQQNTVGDLGFMIAFIYFVALVFGVIIVVWDIARGKSKWQWKSAAGGIGLGVINYFSTFCVYNSMRCFDNVVLFPIYNIGVVSLTALTGWLLFKEKLTWKNYLGLGIAIIAVILITFRP